MDYSDFDNELRIADAFLQRYIQASEEIPHLLAKFDKEDYRANVALNTPSAFEYLESRTQEELAKKLIIQAIAVSVAAAVVEGMRLQDK